MSHIYNISGSCEEICLRNCIQNYYITPKFLSSAFLLKKKKKNHFKTHKKKKKKRKLRHVRYTVLKKLHDKVFKNQLSCSGALRNIWPSHLAIYAQVCPWFVEGKSRKPHNSLASWCFQFSSDPNNPLKTTPETSLTIIVDSWEREQSVFPPQTCQDTLCHSRSSGVLWDVAIRDNLVLQGLMLGYEQALKSFYLKRECKAL